MIHGSQLNLLLLYSRCLDGDLPKDTSLKYGYSPRFCLRSGRLLGNHINISMRKYFHQKSASMSNYEKKENFSNFQIFNFRQWRSNWFKICRFPILGNENQINLQFVWHSKWVLPLLSILMINSFSNSIDSMLFVEFIIFMGGCLYGWDLNWNFWLCLVVFSWIFFS